MAGGRLKIRKGDNVVVIAGKDRGKRGKVARGHADEHRVIVQGVNIVKRHTKATRAGADRAGSSRGGAAPAVATSMLV